MAGWVLTIRHDVHADEALLPVEGLFGPDVGMENLDRGPAGAEGAVDGNGPATPFVEAGQARLRGEFVADHDVRRQMAGGLVGHAAGLDLHVHVALVHRPAEHDVVDRAGEPDARTERAELADRVDLQVATGGEAGGRALVHNSANEQSGPDGQHLVERQFVELEKALDYKATVVLWLRCGQSPANWPLVPVNRPRHWDRAMARRVERLLPRGRTWTKRRKNFRDDEPTTGHEPEADHDWREQRSLQHIATAGAAGPSQATASVQSTAGCAAAKRPHDRGGGRG